MTRLPFLYVFPIYLDLSRLISMYLDLSRFISIYLDVSPNVLNIQYPSVCVKELPVLRNSTLLIVNIV